MDGQRKDQDEFERAARAMQGTLDYAGKAGIQDGGVRAGYQRDIERLVSELRREAAFWAAWRVERSPVWPVGQGHRSA
jgi:hypothetical protein